MAVATTASPLPDQSGYRREQVRGRRVIKSPRYFRDSQGLPIALGVPDAIATTTPTMELGTEAMFGMGKC